MFTLCPAAMYRAVFCFSDSLQKLYVRPVRVSVVCGLSMWSCLVVGSHSTSLFLPLIRSCGVVELAVTALVIRSLSLLVGASPWLTGGRTISCCVAVAGSSAL